MVARLKNDDAEVSTRALDELCAQSCHPVCCLIRQRGVAHHDAEDVLHGYLAKLLRLDAFANLAAEKGRLRTFLAKSLDRFLTTRQQGESRRAAREVSVDDEQCFRLETQAEAKLEDGVARKNDAQSSWHIITAMTPDGSSPTAS